MNTLTIENKEYAVVPMDDYQSMLLLQEDFDDTLAIEKAREDVLSNDDELLPSDFVEKLVLSDENKVKLWRKYRDINITQLSQQTDINIATISRIENNKREPTLKQVKILANALNVDIDDLV